MYFYLFILLTRESREFFSAHGVIGNTTEFGSVIGGSSPSVLTLFFMFIIHLTQIPLLVKVGVFLLKTI